MDILQVSDLWEVPHLDCFGPFMSISKPIVDFLI